MPLVASRTNAKKKNHKTFVHMFTRHFFRTISLEQEIYLLEIRFTSNMPEFNRDFKQLSIDTWEPFSFAHPTKKIQTSNFPRHFNTPSVVIFPIHCHLLVRIGQIPNVEKAALKSAYCLGT